MISFPSGNSPSLGEPVKVCSTLKVDAFALGGASEPSRNATANAVVVIAARRQSARIPLCGADVSTCPLGTTVECKNALSRITVDPIALLRFGQPRSAVREALMRWRLLVLSPLSPSGRTIFERQPTSIFHRTPE